jgi:hypothetical protein
MVRGRATVGLLMVAVDLLSGTSTNVPCLMKESAADFCNTFLLVLETPSA